MSCSEEPRDVPMTALGLREILRFPDMYFESLRGSVFHYGGRGSWKCPAGFRVARSSSGGQ